MLCGAIGWYGQTITKTKNYGRVSNWKLAVTAPRRLYCTTIAAGGRVGLWVNRMRSGCLCHLVSSGWHAVSNSTCTPGVRRHPPRVTFRRIGPTAWSPQPEDCNSPGRKIRIRTTDADVVRDAQVCAAIGEFLPAMAVARKVFRQLPDAEIQVLLRAVQVGWHHCCLPPVAHQTLRDI